jgi:hypothetical protein
VSLALYFDRRTVIYGNPANECLHVDPYFFDLEPEREHVARGFLVAGDPSTVESTVARLTPGVLADCDALLAAQQTVQGSWPAKCERTETVV